MLVLCAEPNPIFSSFQGFFTYVILAVIDQLYLVRHYSMPNLALGNFFFNVFFYSFTISGHVVDNCPNLAFIGLMTIGDLGHSLASAQRISEEGGPNPDFLTLIKCRR